MTLNERDETDQKLIQLRPVIKRASRSVAYQWPSVIEADDVEQSLFLHLVERPNSVDKILGMEDRARYRAIVGVGHQLASKERTDYDHFHGNYRYSVDEVKGVLGRGVLTEDLDDFNEAVVDLMVALEVLCEKTPQYADAVLKRYGDNEVPDTRSEQNALMNGLTSLTNEMNRSNRTRFAERDDGPGTRKVISNAAARDISARQYNGYADDGRF